MALTKAQRAALREKFQGRCAYCGSLLGERWHADHIEPIGRNDWFRRAGITAPPRGPDHPHRDTLENMNPACPPCNIDKHSMSLEDWRGIIARSNDVLMRDVSTFRRALRYGLVSINSQSVIFHFEHAARSAKEGAQQSAPTTQAAPQPAAQQGDAEQREVDARHAAIYRWMLSHIADVLNIFDNWSADEEAGTDELHDVLAARAAKEGGA